MTRARSSYEQLLTYYWRTIDPTVKDAQFCDHGNQYRTAIFVRNDEERKLAEASKKQVEAELKKPIYTADRRRRAVLRGRGLSPGFLSEEPDQI